jgi:hypothetical protein
MQVAGERGEELEQPRRDRRRRIVVGGGWSGSSRRRVSWRRSCSMRDWRWREGSVPLCRLRVIIEWTLTGLHTGGDGITTNFEACQVSRLV